MSKSVLVSLLTLWAVASLPVWTSRAASLPATSTVAAAAIGYGLMLILPLWASKEWEDCASFDKTIMPKHARHWWIAGGLLAVIVGCDLVAIYLVREVGKFPPPKPGFLGSSCFWLINIVVTILLGPIAEEVLWRGYALEQLRKLCHSWVAVVLHAAVFAADHIYERGVLGCVLAFYFAIAFGWYRVRYRALLPIIVCHLAMNALYVLLPIVIRR